MRHRRGFTLRKVAVVSGKRKWQLVFFLFFMHLLLLAVFVSSGGNPVRPDSERYFVLSESLCNGVGFYGPNVRYRTGALRVTEPKDGFEGRENLEESVPEVFRTPGYPAFLCLLDKAGLSSQHAKVVLQSILFLVTTLFVYSLVKRLDDPKIALSLIVLMLMTPGGLVYSLTLYSEVLFLMLFSAALLLCFYYLRKYSVFALILSAVLFALAFYVKPSVLYLPVLIAPVIVLFVRGRGWQPLMHALLFISLFAAGIAPWLYRNQMHYQAPYISGQMSNMLAIYHLPDVWNDTEGTPTQEARLRARQAVDNAVLEEESQRMAYLNSVEIFNLQQKYALDELKEYPEEYARLWVFGMLKTIKGDYSGRLYHLLSGEPIFWGESNGNTQNQALQLFFKFIVKIESVFWLAVCALAALALLRGCFQADSLVLISGLIIAYYVFIPGSMGYSRFRFPVEWLILWQSLHGLQWLIELFHGRRNAIASRRVLHQ